MPVPVLEMGQQDMPRALHGPTAYGLMHRHQWEERTRAWIRGHYQGQGGCESQTPRCQGSLDVKSGSLLYTEAGFILGRARAFEMNPELPTAGRLWPGSGNYFPVTVEKEML